MAGDRQASRIRRVRGLLEKAAATDSEHEREALQTKAMELMARYGIEDAQLNAVGPQKGREKIILVHLDPLGGTYEDERWMLLASVATPLRCAVYRREAPNRCLGYTMIGHESDVGRVRLLFSYLDLHALRSMQRVLAVGAAEQRKARRSWLRGFSLSINIRLQQIEGNLVEEATASTPGTDLILANRQQEVLREARRLFPDVSLERFDSPEVSPASAAGYREGQRVDLGTQGRVEKSATPRSVGR